MSIEALGGNSQDDEHVWLKNPLSPKNIQINAHTPLDEPQDEKAVNQNDFIGKYRGTKAAVYKHKDDNYSFGMKSEISKIKEDEAAKFESSSSMIENSKVNSFQASNLSAKDIVSGALENGRSVKEAYAVYKTQEAYKTSVGKSKTPIKDLANRNFRAHN